MPGVRRRNDISLRDAKGRTIVCPGDPLLPGEEPQTAEVTDVKVGFRSLRVTFRKHPTCGSFSWTFPSGTRVELNEKPQPKGVAKR